MKIKLTPDYGFTEIELHIVGKKRQLWFYDDYGRHHKRKLYNMPNGLTMYCDNIRYMVEVQDGEL